MKQVLIFQIYIKVVLNILMIKKVFWILIKANNIIINN